MENKAPVILSDTPMSDLLDRLCPHYMAIGLSYEEFWHGNVFKWKYLRDAYLLKKREQNEMLWLQGAYVHDAFGAVLANAFSKKGSGKAGYMKEPIRITPMTEEEKEAENQKIVSQFRSALQSMTAHFEAKHARERALKEQQKQEETPK